LGVNPSRRATGTLIDREQGTRGEGQTENNSGQKENKSAKKKKRLSHGGIKPWGKVHAFSDLKNKEAVRAKEIRKKEENRQ